MPKPTLKMLAIDLGASSGRGMIGEFDGKKLSLRENHRFPNDPVNISGAFMWDILRIFHEIKKSLGNCANSEDCDISTIGIDTWGVDFGLLDKTGLLLENPYHYRDKRTDNIEFEAYKRIPKHELYKINGLQYLPFNTIYQLLALSAKRPHAFENAETLLMTPDLLNYFLTGAKKTEYTIASTSALLDAKKRTWAKELFSPMGIPEKLFTEIVPPGNILGGLLPDVLKEVGNLPAQVVNVASHDTGSAIAAVPASGDAFVYISSGTWSLMGTEAKEPIINEKSARYDFTNEGGVANTIRVLKNVAGLWLEQESKRQWEREGEKNTFNELTEMAIRAKPLGCLIDVDSPEFVSPGDMPGRIREFCRRTAQHIPQNKGEVVRCIFDSLALAYKRTLACIEELQGEKTPFIHVVGGGTKESLLCQFTADACGVPVYAGPVEATALGNIAVQMMAKKEISSLAEARKIIADSFEVVCYEPKNTSIWDDAFERYEKIINIK
ncbi:MAG: rhamnulokinase [Oscillospiraceae bacterium]|nr:rhamnulokinase [Oscillospiraceae bacterium]